jgi:hypothetical protein
MKRQIAIAAVTIGLGVSGCGGGDDDEATATPVPRETPGAGTPQPGGAGALPPEFLECMADEGFDVSSADDVHAAPQQVLQECFGSLHGGGGTP